jgi:alpha-1,2-mannosyltransferase
MAIVVALYFGFVGWTYHKGDQKAARGERPLFTDFTSTYGAALLLKKEAAEYLYLQEHMMRATEEAGNAAYNSSLSDAQKKKVGFAPWMYPPTFIAVVLPLGYLSYFGALIFWLAVTAIPYFMAMRAILPNDKMAIWIAMAAPPFFYNVMFGQTGFLSAGLIGLGLFHVLQRPWLAGMLIGLASVKPHLGLLIPFALLAGGHWRVFLSASITVAIMILASILAFGMEPWFAFIGTTLFHLDGFQYGAYVWNIMTSVLSVAYLSGVKLESAWQLQAYASAICIVLVLIVWWRGRHQAKSFNLQAAVLCSAIPLAFPMAYLYDLVVLVVALAWLMQDMKMRGFKPWEAATIWLSMFGLLLVKPLGGIPGIHVGILSIAALLFLSLFRFRLMMIGGGTE